MYSLLHLNTGFYGNAGEEPIFKRFPVKNSFTSSCLRLYGCSAISAQASPTLIFGDVWRRYLQAAAVAPVVEGRLEKIVPLDWILKHQDVPRELGMPPFLFLSPPLYQVYMSQTREEPFNRSWDHIFSSEEQPPGLHLKHRYKKRFGNPYPLIDSTFDLANVNGDIIYNGKLAHFDMARSVEPKISEVFESVADLMDLRSEKGDGGRQITLNGFVLIKGNRSDLRPFCPLTVSGRGSMVFEGDLSIGDIFLADPEKDLCSVISLAGSIQLSGTHFDCGFAALKGKIIPGTSKIRGFIACDKVNPDLLRGGSTIQYDSRINPEQPSWNSFYTLSLSPRVSLFRVE
jgi:hypothetical protein